VHNLLLHCADLTTGGSDDFAKHSAGIKYSYTLEVRGSNFVMSRSDISPAFYEVWNGIKAMVKKINTKQLNVWSSSLSESSSDGWNWPIRETS